MNHIPGFDFQCYVGGRVKIEDHAGTFVIDGPVVRIDSERDTIRIHYEHDSAEGGDVRTHEIEHRYFHAARPNGVFVSDLIGLTITFSPP